MAFSPTSQPIQRPKWQPPISEDLLLKGAVYTNSIIEKNTESANLLIDNLYNLPSLPGEDTVKKKQIIDDVMNQVSSITHNDLRNPGVLNNLKSYIKSVTNSPDLSAIIERGHSYEQELKNKSLAESKGKAYFSPIINQAQKYINDGLYIRDARFNGLGFQDPELSKLTSEALKNVQKIKTLKNGKLIESYDPSSLITEVGNVYNNPAVQQYLDYQFENSHSDIPWEDLGIQEAKTALSTALNTKNTINNLLEKDPYNLELKNDLEDIEKSIRLAESAINNPIGIGKNVKKDIKIFS